MKNSNCIVAWAVFATSLLLIAATATAQDVAKVSPETHKVLLENDHVRALDFHVKPGEKVGVHSHLTDLGESKLRGQRTDQGLMPR
jgi:hypothetical protein